MPNDPADCDHTGQSTGEVWHDRPADPNTAVVTTCLFDAAGRLIRTTRVDPKLQITDVILPDEPHIVE